METETFLFSEETKVNYKNIHLPKMTNEDRDYIKRHIEITRHIQEIDQLFHIFRVNLKNILYFYDLNNDDTISCKNILDIGESELTIINSMVINYISSGKTLKESIENFMKLNIGEDSIKYTKFKSEVINKIYDDVFYFRFLLRIRDFAQHGHIPVSVDFENKYCFNIEKILQTPHFEHNKKLKSEMEHIWKEIYDKYHNHPRIIFTVSLAEFNLAIIKIHKSFIDIIEDELQKSKDKVKFILQESPNYIYNSKDCFNGFVFYDNYNGFLHCFNPKDDCMKMLLNIKTEVNKIEIEETKELRKLKSGLKFI